MLHALFTEPEPAIQSRHIVVDRPALLRFMQYQARAFEPETFAASLDAMSAAERQRLVEDYVREEVLYREALALGLERGDYVMRQRLVQKMSFLLEAQPEGEPGEAGLQQYLADNAQLYRIEPAWTFTHVFLDPALHGGEAGAERAARTLLATLNRRRAGFNDAPGYGDRFAFMQNYVERTADFIDSHFGAQFAAGIAGLAPDAAAWRGPIQSTHGWHLVMLTSFSPGRLPRLEEIRERVADDLRRERAASLHDQALRALVAGYEVELHGLEASR